MKNFALLITTPIALSAIVMFVFQRAENPRSEYGSYEELVDSGMISRGWLPAYLPKSAIEIKTRGNLDTGAFWASFKYEIGDSESVEDACMLIAETKIGMKFLCPSHDKFTTTILLRNDGQGRYSSHADGI